MEEMDEIWDATKLNSYACEMQGHYAMEKNLVGKEPSEALAFGIGFHKAVEVWTEEAEMEIAKKSFLTVWEKELPLELREKLEFEGNRRSYGNFCRLFEAYIKKFPIEMFNEIVAQEIPFTLYLGATPNGREINWSGVLDRVVKWQDGIYYVDIKTSSYPCNEKFFNQFRLSKQMIGYTWAGQELGIGNFAGIMIHGIEVKSPPKTARARTVEDLIQADIIPVIPEHIEEWKLDTLQKIDDIYRARERKRWIRDRGELCNSYGGCAFRTICDAHPDLRQKRITEHYVERIWNPLERQ